jgi:hypothetical protein
MPHRFRSVLIVLVGLGIGYFVLDRLASHPSFQIPKDFVEYWAAGAINLRGDNPYDPALLLAQQHLVDPTRTEAVMMWNPPWTLALYMPLGLLSVRWAALVWLSLQLIAILYACILLWRVVGGPRNLEWIASLVGLTFGPTLWTIIYGQNTGFLLLGLVGFVSSWKAGKPASAGAFAALTCLKPHLLAVFGALLILDGLTSRGRVALAVGTGLVAISLGIAALANPHVIGEYWAAVQNPGTGAVPLAGWQLPVASYQFRMKLAPSHFWVQLVPAGLTCLGYAVYRVVRGNRWDWVSEMPGVVLASALATPYGGWMFDLVILLVPVLMTVVWVVNGRRWATGAFVAIGLLVVTVAPFVQGGELHYYWWVAPAVLTLYVLAALSAEGDLQRNNE